MKNIFISSLLLLCFTSIAQNNKSLFWEISGNGLTKKSYLYGTMHVNEKVSYHLSDAFFANLLAADMVGNESDPETWVDIVDLMKSNEITTFYKFYTEFYLEPVKKENIKTVFATNTSYFNNMLSAMGGDSSDFQENTVLDMFIYQTGRKYNKKIVGLEKAKESIIPLLKIKEEDAKPKEENKLLLIKLLKNRNFNDVLKEYYREKDVVMLDSIYKLMLSKKAHDVLITNRNEIMTKSIDSLVKKGSLFSAVGAAHLSGKTGIIELLRAKGYTVNPIFDAFTDSGQKQKKNIEDYFPNPNFISSGTKDGMIQMPLNKNVVDEVYNLGSPDFTNGGVTNIKRIPLNYFISKDKTLYNSKSLDSLFFENIPGNILEKTYFEEENYTGYDIKNVTKTGNNQHYRFYITPLELIGVTMIGVGNYVKQFENEVFDNIKIKSFTNNWDTIIPEKGGFSVEIPAFNTVHGNTTKNISNIEIQAFDNADKSYYFLTEKTLNDCEILENSEYEQKQIHYEFYLQHKVDSLNTNYDKLKHSFESSSAIGDKKIKLKSFIKGNKYYLLGTVNANDKNSTRYFNSFAFVPVKYTSKAEILTDSISNLTIQIPKKENEKLFLKLNQEKDDSKNTFSYKNENYTFQSETGRTINLQYYKYPKYESVANMDSIRTIFKKYFLKQSDDDDYMATDYNYDEDEEYENATSLLNYSLSSKKGFSHSSWNKLMVQKDEKLEILSENETHNKEKNSYTFDAIVSKPSASQAIKQKVVFNQNSYYLMQTLVDKNYKNDDEFIENTFASLQPLEKNEASLFDDKLKLFIEDVKSEKDTIRYSALHSIYQLKIEKKDFDTLKDFLNTFEFKDSETESIESLISKMGEIQDERVIPFLEELYKKENTKTAIQISVLKAISDQKSKIGYAKIMDLLEYDLPISDNDYDITSLFYYFNNDLENSKYLFPKIFQFYSIKEYNKPIIEFCNSLLDKNLASTNKINSFKKMIITNAKLEYKRIVSWKENNNASDENEEIKEYETTAAPVDDFINYINLLYNFKTENAITELIEKAQKLDIEELNVELIRLGIVNNKISTAKIQEALSNPKTRFLTVNLLLNKNKKELINLSDDEIAASAVINFKNTTEKDSISLLEKRIIENEGKQISIYFYEIIKSVEEDEPTEKLLFPIAFISDGKKINPLAFKSFPSETIEDEDDVNEKMDIVIKKYLNQNHSRASFEKENPIDTNFLFNDY